MKWPYEAGVGEQRVTLIQLVVKGTKTIYLFRVSAFSSRDDAPSNLVALLEHPRFLKVGRGIQNDLLKLQRDWGLQYELRSGYIDVLDLAVSKGWSTL